MKILSSDQIRKLDSETIKLEKISSWQLMERASYRLFQILRESYGDKTRFSVFCGKGNNGGDGLALVRMLNQKGYPVEAYLWEQEVYSPDNLQNQKLLQQAGIKVQTFSLENVPELPKQTVIVDALFGNGLNRPLDSAWQKLFDQIAASNPKEVVAVDLPSGFLVDQKMPEDAPCLVCHRVLTFEMPKLGLLLPDNQKYLSDFTVVSIDLDEKTKASFATEFYYTDKFATQKRLKPAGKFAHKGTFGHVLIAGGSYGKIGAIVLSARAALRTGSGLVSAWLPQCGYSIMQSTAPEVMCQTDSSDRFIAHFPEVEAYSAVAIGMGLGQEKETEQALLDFLTKAPKARLLLDADALNLLAKQPDPFALIPPGTILTPHPGELKRLIGAWNDDFEKITRVQKIAVEKQIIIVVKGAHTMTALPSGKVWFNSTGNYGMATAGSGDTLSGMIVSLLGQKYTPEDAALLGVYLHGLAGDLAVQKIHPHSLIASDIATFISEAYNFLNSPS